MYSKAARDDFRVRVMKLMSGETSPNTKPLSNFTVIQHNETGVSTTQVSECQSQALPARLLILISSLAICM